jgi:D-arginine dehydrogenase
MKRSADVAIIGAGMAGASLAAEIAPHLRVLLIEAESQPGYHSTGRSAAFWSETYGGPHIQPLTSASGPFLAAPPAEFSDRPFLRPRGAIHIADREGSASLEAMRAEFRDSAVELHPLDGAALQARVTGLKAGWETGLWEPSCADIDVAALHAAYLRAARRAGVELLSETRIEAAVQDERGWTLLSRQGSLQCGMIVNAAGAWADEVALLAGEAPIGIQPFRRTIAQLRVDPPVPADLPLVVDVSGRFYFKPEAGGRLWLSPHDETPCPPCDSAAEEEDVAVAIERLGSVVDWKVERVEHKWAGLRSFAPDRLPVYGFARDSRSFFWCAGQGGFGIQTAPAGARLAASLLLGRPTDPMLAGIDPSTYRADRFWN